MAEKINRHLNLLVPETLIAHLNREIDFLGIGSRLVVIEQREIGKRNEFIRLIVGQYCDRFFAGFVEPVELDEETDYLPFYLDRQSEGKWNVAIKQNAAASYNQLVTAALYDYFCRQEILAQNISNEVEIYKERLKNINLAELRKLAV